MEEENQEHQRRSGLTPGKIIVVIVILIAVASLISDPFGVNLRKQRKAADRTEAIWNIRRISMLLTEFEADYGRYPDDETVLEVKRRTTTGFTLSGEYSNDYFRQLLASGSDKSEKPFWCKTPQSPRKPDDDFSTPAKALEAGEVGFSYIMASAKRGQSSKEGPDRPVVVAPSYRFQTDWTFDPELYLGRAVVLRADGSSSPLPISQAGEGASGRKVMTGPGKTLGDMGPDTPWGTGMNPILRAPQPR